MDVYSQEAATGVRMSWNIWPASRLDATRAIVPLGCLYTPLKAINKLTLVEYVPVQCNGRDCEVILNPYCAVDFRSKCWTCPMCRSHNAFPQHYAEHISESVFPAELLPNCGTMEYILPDILCPPPVFLLVLDAALIDEELEQAKDSLQQSLAMMPQNALVGFLTFGRMVHVYELGVTILPKSHALRGTKEYSAQQVAFQLGFTRHGDPRFAQLHGSDASKRFLLPVAQCEFTLSCILDGLVREDWKNVGASHRPCRCTGAALSVALGLLEVTRKDAAAHVVLLTGGPCSVGPGMVVGEELSETIRSHLDLRKDTANAKHTNKALTFYVGLASRAVACGVAVDIFAASLDQVGLYEMRVLAERSGGHVVMSDSFSTHVFKGSFRKMFESDDFGYLLHGFNAKIEVSTSRDFKCCGAIGGLCSLRTAGPGVSDTLIGESGTSRWTAGSLDKNSTVAFYFDITRTAQHTGEHQQAYLQIKTSYLHASGRKRLRVTTVSHRLANPDIREMEMSCGFDQEAATVLLAKWAVFKLHSEELTDVIRWLDRLLIRSMAKFADYQRDDPSSFRLSREFQSFPQFMYHLRRSNILQISNASPDETAYYRTHITRETTSNSLLMIQPALLQYSLNESEPHPVPLDATSLNPKVVLLLDAFFYIVIRRGATTQAWFDAGYHEKEEYANFKELITAPAEDAKRILADRFPLPNYMQTHAGGSQDRLVTSKVNPSSTHNSTDGLATGTEILTDDVSLMGFMMSLIKLTVSS